MTGRTPLDDHMDDFGRELRRVDRPRAGRASGGRRWMRPAIGVGGLATIGAGALALTIFPGGPGKIDIVSEARAALETPGSLVHVVYQDDFGWVDDGPGRPVDPEKRHEMMRQNACSGLGSTTEIWSSTTGPRRHRMVGTYSPCIVNVTRGHAIEPGAEYEHAYADGVVSDYFPGNRLLLRMTDLLPSDRNLTELYLPGDQEITGKTVAYRDPVERIRELLASGKLRDAGRFKGPNGRALWRLSGTAKVPGDPERWPMRIEYVVDAETFAPVSYTMTARSRAEDGGNDGPAVDYTLRFKAYERMPLTPEREALLAIQPAQGTQVETRTAREVRKKQRGTHGRADDPAAYARIKAIAQQNQREADAEVEAQIRAEERTGDVAPTTP